MGHQHLALAWQGYNIRPRPFRAKAGKRGVERRGNLESVEHFAAIPGGQSQHIRAALNSQLGTNTCVLSYLDTRLANGFDPFIYRPSFVACFVCQKRVKFEQECHVSNDPVSGEDSVIPNF